MLSSEGILLCTQKDLQQRSPLFKWVEPVISTGSTPALEKDNS